MLIGGELGARRSHARDFHSLAFFFPRTSYIYIYILIRPSIHSSIRPSSLNRLDRYESVGIGTIILDKISIIRHFRSNLFLSFEDKEKMKKVEQISLIKIDFSLFFVLSFETDDRSRFYMEWKKEENSISVIIIVIIMMYMTFKISIVSNESISQLEQVDYLSLALTLFASF